MRKFNSGGSSSRGGFSGGRRGGFSSGGQFAGRSRENRDSRFSGGRKFERSDRLTEMHDAICGNCGNKCRVPFKPTGSRPVLCSDCFRASEGSNQRGNSNSRGSFNPRSSGGSDGNSEQLSKIDAKLDKILAFLQNLEIETDEDDVDEDSEEESEEEK